MQKFSWNKYWYIYIKTYKSYIYIYRYIKTLAKIFMKQILFFYLIYITRKAYIFAVVSRHMSIKCVCNDLKPDPDSLSPDIPDILSDCLLWKLLMTVSIWKGQNSNIPEPTPKEAAATNQVQLRKNVQSISTFKRN